MRFAMYTECCNHEQRWIFWGLRFPLVHHERNPPRKCQNYLSQYMFSKGAFFPAEVQLLLVLPSEQQASWIPRQFCMVPPLTSIRTQLCYGKLGVSSPMGCGSLLHAIGPNTDVYQSLILDLLRERSKIKTFNTLRNHTSQQLSDAYINIWNN